MKKFYFGKVALVLCLLFSGAAYAEITTQDYKQVVQNTKMMAKLANQSKLDELSKYYSENYKSFDGYDKKQIMEIYKVAAALYPNMKSKEKIEKIETKDDTIKVFIKETAKSKSKADDEEEPHLYEQGAKGEMNSYSYYSMLFKKENDKWLVVSDEIYSEITDFRYGEAIDTGFEMETPELIEGGEQFCVKINLEIPENRFVMGSIGHDEILFPPSKYADPYRTIGDEGSLERIMIANKNGRNEYASATYVYIAPNSKKIKKKTRQGNAYISGSGVYVKRLNIKKEDTAL